MFTLFASVHSVHCAYTDLVGKDSLAQEIKKGAMFAHHDEYAESRNMPTLVRVQHSFALTFV